MTTRASDQTATPPWHLLQISGVLDMELASALSELVPVIAWKPKRSLLPLPPHVPPDQREQSAARGLQVREFRIARGYARSPLWPIARPGRALARETAECSGDPVHSPLICTTPFFAHVAETWPGPVIYWLTDLMAEYESVRGRDIRRLDRRMCNAATMVCPNSERLADYLIREAGCNSSKIRVIPNASRATNVYAEAPAGPSALPKGISNLTRPIAGVIGNLADNMDWVFLREVIAATPKLTWLFVGPVAMEMADAAQSEARDAVIEHPRTQFIGALPYGRLAEYARTLDVAVLPYRRREPTYSGSSTRFYEHLLACRPMVATSVLDELNKKRPLVQIADEPGEMARSLQQLQEINFEDGLTEQRWSASKDATWNTRAQTMMDALDLLTHNDAHRV